MADIIKTTLDKKSLTDLVDTREVVVKKETALLETVINEVLAMLKSPAAYGGYGGIAKKAEISKSQVKRIHTMMKERIAELTPVPEAVL